MTKMKMDSHILISWIKFKVVITIMLFLVGCNKDNENKRPNILFITTDYQAGQDIPGETSVLKMPNLDKISQNGVTFQNHLCTAPICMPSRYTIVSGLYPHTHGQWDNSNQWLPEGTPTLMECLSEAGYTTIGVGKMHFKPWERMAGFSKRIFADRKGNGPADTLFLDDYASFLKTSGLNRWDYLKKQSQQEIYGLYDWPFADSLHIDHFVGDQAVKFVNSNGLPAKKPWFMWVSFNGPHNPWDPPVKYTKPYLDFDLPPAVRVEGELSENPYHISLARYNYTRPVVDSLDRYPDKWVEYIHRIRAGHFGGLSFIDEQLGKVMKSLDENGELDNTIIIYSSDHGAHLGDHNLIHKGTHYDRSARVPFIVSWPGRIKPGKISGFTSHVDIMPTLLEIAGVQAPLNMEGKSILNVMLGKEEAASYGIVEIFNNYSLISKDYLYGIFPSSKEEVLFDKRTDHNELYNLAFNPEYTGIKDSLRNLLVSFHPPIQEEYNESQGLEEIPERIQLQGSESLLRGKCPYLGGKAFRFELEFFHTPQAEGPLVTFYEDRSHGLTLIVKDGKINLGMRTWGVDEIQPAIPISAGKVQFHFTMNENGQVTIALNGRNVRNFQSSWPLPVQPGNKYYLTGAWSVSKPVNKWVKPIGDYKPDDEYTGDNSSVNFQLFTGD